MKEHPERNIWLRQLNSVLEYARWYFAHFVNQYSTGNSLVEQTPDTRSHWIISLMYESRRPHES